MTKDKNKLRAKWRRKYQRMKLNGGYDKMKERYTNKRRKFKKELIDYKGGKCQICGYNKCLGALEFHHQDNKEGGIAEMISHFVEIVKLKKEVDKCILICANCHRETHYKN